eukprot:2568336-Prymnesium_polylepis.1
MTRAPLPHWRACLPNLAQADSAVPEPRRRAPAELLLASPALSPNDFALPKDGGSRAADENDATPNTSSTRVYAVRRRCGDGVGMSDGACDCLMGRVIA